MRILAKEEASRIACIHWAETRSKRPECERLYNSGLSVKAIAKTLSIGTGTVSRWTRILPRRNTKDGMGFKWSSKGVQAAAFTAERASWIRLENRYENLYREAFKPSRVTYLNCRCCGIEIVQLRYNGKVRQFCSRLCKRQFYRDNLSDRYILDNIVYGTGLSARDIPPDLIAVKRAHYQLKRAMRKHRYNQPK